MYDRANCLVYNVRKEWWESISFAGCSSYWKSFEFLRISIILTLGFFFFFVDILYPTFHWIIEKAREFQKSIYFCFIDYTKALHGVDESKLWKILKGKRIPEATVKTGHGTMNCFQIGKGVHQSCILSPCLFNLYAEYIVQNAGVY